MKPKVGDIPDLLCALSHEENNIRYLIDIVYEFNLDQKLLLYPATILAQSNPQMIDALYSASARGNYRRAAQNLDSLALDHLSDNRKFDRLLHIVQEFELPGRLVEMVGKTLEICNRPFEAAYFYSAAGRTDDAFRVCKGFSAMLPKNC